VCNSDIERWEQKKNSPIPTFPRFAGEGVRTVT
jgi:hypothetical protein